MKPITRYNPSLVVLHWLLAAVIIAMLVSGVFWLAPMPSSAAKVEALRWHMSTGMAILGLMLVRFIVRIASSHPARASTGSALLDRIAVTAHYGFYALVLFMAATGMTTAILAGLNKSVFQGSGDPLPSSFVSYPSFVMHAFGAFTLIGLIGLHAAAALYHQFVVRDGIFSRMSVGGRTREMQGILVGRGGRESRT